MARRGRTPGSVATALGHIWQKRRLVWHIASRDLAQNETLQRLALVGVLILLISYAVAFLMFRPEGLKVGEPALSDWELGARVALASLYGIMLTFSLFVASYTAQRSQGSLKNYFSHPVGVAEVLAAKMLFVLVSCTIVTAVLLLPLVPFVQAGVMPAERAAGLAVLAFSALAASYLCLVFGVALALLLHDRATGFRPEGGILASLGLFILDSRWMLGGAIERLLSFKAGLAGEEVSPGELRAAGDWAAVLSSPSPFEAAHNLARAALSHPAFPWGVAVSLALVLAVVLWGLGRAHRTYPEEVF